MKFIDKSKIRVVSGRGGNGMVAWRREKYVDKGGPAGGDGGRGGDVYLIADENMSTLMDFKHKSVFKAEAGENGGIKNMHGHCAKDLYIKVPVGTVVKDVKTGNIIADLKTHEQTVLVAKGGRGGRGNARFATAQKRAPQFCEPGEPSIERELFLELKLIADVGLLGMPNAGKSTLISRISSAKPKIADYPFTTLIPNLGVVKKHNGDGYVVADIPGLIEGASEGVGLGHDFLRHVERCRFLVHLIDSTEENPLENYKKINLELKKYSEKLSKLYQIVVLNKIDAIDEKRKAELFLQFEEAANQLSSEKSGKLKVDKDLSSYSPNALSPVLFAISAVTGENLETLLDFMGDKVDEIPQTETEIIVEEDLGAYNNDDSAFEIFKVDKDTFIIQGGKVERIAGVTDERNAEQVIRFQNILKGMGVFDELSKKGIKDGDTVIIGHLEFAFFKDEIYG
ncbi:GTPase ObgE [bacterium]|nr:GTPase ObgE [bacterium]